MAATKLGLALSGGGFRASFFHIGVLARLAEQGLLNRVEVISTVSGGSIIGALYYLHVKKLLEAKPDGDVTADDYVRCVETIQADFLRGVQKNIRTRTFVNLWKNLKMMRRGYSRSDRLGELYDEHFYRPVLAPGTRDLIEMRQLKIRPAGFGPGDFRPDRDNAARQSRVPVLLLNATTLNTGHNWRFEAGWMGEPNPEPCGPRQELVDANTVLAQCESYDHVVERQANVELGLAVAASACVPGLFPPLALSGLYDGYRVQLVDGGVHDNQGVKGLLERNCTHFIVSDASGQLGDEPEPPVGPLSVVARVNGIMMDRVREEALCGLFARHGERVALMHLRKGLPTGQLHPLPNETRPPSWQQEPLPPQTPSSTFGVDPEVQALLSRLRTDLDSFSDIEAGALMADGYLMTAQETPAVIAGLDAPPPAEQGGDWPFLALRQEMSAPSELFRKHLAVGEKKFLRAFRLCWPLTAASVVALAALACGAWLYWGACVEAWLNKELSYGELLAWVAVCVIAIALPAVSRAFKVASFARNPSERLIRALVAIGAALLGGTLLALHLYTIDRLLLSMGKVSRLTKFRREVH